MARLPRSPISEGVSNNYRPVREARASGADPVGQALEGAGNAGFEIASRMADAKIATQAAQVELELANRLDQERRALEDDNEVDPANLETMFQERAGKAVAEISGKINSPALKRAFGQSSAEALQRNTFQVRDVSRRKQVDQARGEFVTTMDAYTKTYDEPSNYMVPNGYDTSPAQDRLASQQSLIKAQFRAGVIDAETAAQQALKAEDAYALGLQGKHLKAIEDALDRGDYSGADSYFLANSGDFTTPEMRERTRDVIEMKKQEGMAVTMADKLWSGSGQSYETAITEASKITNVDERLAVEARLGQLKNQFDAGQKAVQDVVINDALMAITAGKSVPSSVMQRADGRTREFIADQIYQRNYRNKALAGMTAEQARLTKEASAIDRDYLTSFGGDPATAPLYLSGPAAWKEEAPGLYEQYSMLTELDQRRVVDDINTRITNGGSTTASDKVFAELVQAVPMLQPADAEGVKYGDARSTKKTPAAEEKLVRASLQRQAEEYARRTGGAPVSNEDRKTMIARAFREADPAKYPAAGVDTFGFRVYRESQASITALRETLGRDPTQAEIDLFLQEPAP
jgi:hypothetical protein